MKTPITIATAILTACLTIHAAPAPYPVTINSRAQTAPALLVYRANPATFRVSFTDGSDASVITDETPFMAWATNALATNNSPASYSVVNATNGTVDFTFSAAAVNYAAGRYVYEVGLNTDSGPKTYRQGVFTIQASTVGASVPAVSWTNAVINWGLYGYTGTASNGPVRADGSTITASNNPDGSITLSSLAATPAWGSVTDKPTTFPPLLTATQTVIMAATSGGVTIQNSSGAPSLTIGAGGTGVTTADGLNVTGALQVGGSNVMTELSGKASTGTVAAIDARVTGVETGKLATNATAVNSTLLDGYTIDEIMAVGATYYFTTNIVSYGVVSGRSASLTPPLVAQTLTYAGPVTNGQAFGQYLIPSNEVPAIIQRGVYTFNFFGGHPTNPGKNPTIRGKLSMIHSGTGVTAYEYASVANVVIPHGKEPFHISVNVTNDIAKDSFAVLLTTYMLDTDGYDGAFTSDFGPPTYAGFTFPKVNGLYVLNSEFDATGIAAAGGLTNAAAFATAAQGALADGALQRSGGTMTGDISMGTNTVNGQRFGDSSGVGASGTDYSCIGLMSGYESAGTGWHAAGINAGYGAVGDIWHAAGYYAMTDGRVTNSAGFGNFAGSQARGNNRMYLDVYSENPIYPANGATNDMIFGDNGYLYLGRGGGAPSGAQGGTLRGVWTHSADRDPYVITASTNMIVDRANTDAQRIASIPGGASTIRFTAAVTNYASAITLHVPPVGTNTVTLAAGPFYSFGDGLTGLATTNYSVMFADSPVGSTNWAVTIWKGVPQ